MALLKQPVSQFYSPLQSFQFLNYFWPSVGNMIWKECPLSCQVRFTVQTAFEDPLQTVKSITAIIERDDSLSRESFGWIVWMERRWMASRLRNLRSFMCKHGRAWHRKLPEALWFPLTSPYIRCAICPLHRQALIMWPYLCPADAKISLTRSLQEGDIYQF